MEEEGQKYVTSRIAFIHNYFIIGLIVVFLIILFQTFGFKLTFTPRTINELWPTMLVLIFLMVITFLVEEPVIKRIIGHFLVTDNEVIHVEGIVRKKRTAIPYQSVSDVSVKKGILGRIFNFGDVIITGFKNDIHMIGIREPEIVYKMIEDKVSLSRKMAKKFADKE